MMPTTLAHALRPGAWLLVAVALATCRPTLCGAGQFRALAFTGQPSGIGAAPFRSSPALSASFDAANRVVLSASVPLDGSLILGVWTEEAGALVPKLYDGGPAPGAPAGVNVRRIGFGTPTVQLGLPAIGAALQNGWSAVYVDQPGAGLRLASHTGKIIDSGAGVEVVGFAGQSGSGAPEPIANSAGDVLMFGYLRGGPLPAGGIAAWVERPGSSQIVFHANTTLPGVSGGGKFGDFVSHELAFDDEGHVATIHNFSGGQGVWMFDPTLPRLSPHVANTGTVRDGVAVTGIRELRLAGGRVAFQSDPLRDSIVSSAIFAKQFGVLELVAAENRPAPGFGPAATFRDFTPESIAIDKSGLLAFAGTVDDPAIPDGYSGAIWYDAHGQPPELALRLDDLPTTEWLATGRSRAHHLVMNDHRQLAFQDAGSGALWWFDPTLGARRIAGHGDRIRLIQDGAEVVKSLNTIDVRGFLLTARAPAPYINDNGEVVFIARFSDNTSAVVVWSPVPEPSGAVLAAMALIARGAHRFRHRRR